MEVLAFEIEESNSNEHRNQLIRFEKRFHRTSVVLLVVSILYSVKEYTSNTKIYNIINFLYSCYQFYSLKGDCN